MVNRNSRLRRVAGGAVSLALALTALAGAASAAEAPSGALGGGKGGLCSAIDSYAPSGSEEHTVALVQGRAFAGDWNAQMGNIVWQDLSDNGGYPRNACDITLSEQGDDAWIKVITTRGVIYETRCDASGSGLECEERWTRLGYPMPAGAGDTAR